jgi:hypothetical protein
MFTLILLLDGLVTACAPAPANANAAFPPPPVGENRLWSDTLLEPAVFSAAAFCAVTALVMWWRRNPPAQTLKVLGLQLLCLCAVIWLGYRFVTGLPTGFGSDIYPAQLFFWLGRLSFDLGLATVLTGVAAGILWLSKSRVPQGVVLFGSVLTTMMAYAAWMSLLYAVDVCILGA